MKRFIGWMLEWAEMVEIALRGMVLAFLWASDATAGVMLVLHAVMKHAGE